MRATYYSLGFLASLLFVTGEAMPCGGAFGHSVTIQPAQKIVVGYRNGIETYVFNPEFCGKADTFGLILPVPSPLSANPTLGTQQLYADLATVAAPTIVTKQECSRGAGGSSSKATGGAPGNGGTTIIQRGQVGIFDWALLKADDVSSFTEWLTANGFPYPSSAGPTFQSYVDSGWYFVAFKVSAGGSSGTAGAAGSTGTATSTICGSFGPVSLSFATAPHAVIPARIASVSSSSVSWDIFALGASQMRMRSQSPTLLFSGAISATDLSSHPALAQVAQPGDRLTELSLNTAPSADLILEPDPNQADYRREVVRTQWITCTGGVSSGGGAGKTGSGGSAGSAGNIVNGGSAAVAGNVASGSGIGKGGASSAGQPNRGGSAGNGGNRNTGDLWTNGGSILAGNAGSGSAATPVSAEPAAGCDCAVASAHATRAHALFALLGASMLGYGRLRRRRRG